MTDASDHLRPVQLTVASVLVALQGLTLIGLAVAEALHVVGDRAGVALSTAAFFLVYGVALVGSAWALAGLRAWARGPVLLTQLIQLGLAWNLRDHLEIALPLGVVAGVTLLLVVQRASIEALERAEDPTV